MLENPSTWLRLAKDLIAGLPTQVRILASVGIVLLTAFTTLFLARIGADTLAPTPITRSVVIGLELVLLGILAMIAIILAATVVRAVFYRAK